jgi:hypothetical protein
MSLSPGTPGAPTLLLRLSLPAGDGFRDLGVAVAAKVAEYAGCAAPDAAKVAESLESLAREIAQGDPAADITFEFHRLDDELRIEARCAGRTSEASHPLPA